MQIETSVGLTPDALVWIKELVRRIDAYEEIDFKTVRAALLNKISSDFNPLEIRSIYLFPPCRVTLPAVIQFGNGKKWQRLVNKVINHIKELIATNVKTVEVTAKELSNQLKEPEIEIEISLDLIRPIGNFISQSSGNDFRCEKIRFSSDECFEEYMRFKGIEELLERFKNSYAEKMKWEAKTVNEVKELFILMPMSKKKPLYKDIHDSIKTVAKSFGIKAFRIDDSQSNEKISERILKSIERAEYIVADLTDSRPNVFFEAGYALGIQKIPVFIAREGTKLEFDIHDFPIIFFNNQIQLREELSKRLEGIIIREPDKHSVVQVPLKLHEDENDIKTLLAGWAQKKSDSKSLLETFHFNHIDEELEISNGSSKAFLKDIIIKKWNYVVDEEGPNTIKFKYGPFEIKTRRVISRGIDLDKF
jgi:hypothetical protein